MASEFRPYTNYLGQRVELDAERCKASVQDSESRQFHQCARRAKKEGWCKQHHPESGRARAIASQEKYKADAYRRKWAGVARQLATALEKIRDGDNDPRATAADALEGAGWKG